MPPFSLILREDPKIGDGDLADVTALFSSWRHSVSDAGGPFFGEGLIDQATKWEARQFFRANLGKRLVARWGGIDYYEGQIVEMELVDGGAISVRSMQDMVNAVKMVYTIVGDNQIVNPSVETTAWGNVGSPTTNERSSAWSARGDYSQHIITTGDDQGALVEDGDVTGLSVTAGAGYECSAVIKIVSGAWRLQVKKTSGGGEVIAQHVITETGRHSMHCMVPETNDYSGNVEVRITSGGNGGGGECYADAAVFRTAGGKAETEWITNADSITRHGRIEMIFLEQEMTDDEAIANANLALGENAWPRTRGPGQGSSFRMEEMGAGPQLTVTCMGMYWTLAWRYIQEDVGTGDAYVLAGTVIDLSEFVTSTGAQIETNTAEVQLFIDDPVTLSEALEKILEVGDGSGGAFVAGVWPGMQFRYYARPTDVQYTILDGQLNLCPAGELVPIRVQPGWALNMDLPLILPEGGAEQIDDPRRVWLQEVWFVYDQEGTYVEWTEEE